MFNAGTKFEYNIREKRELVTNIPNQDPTALMVNYLNELGEAGELVLTTQETAEPSQISAANGQKIPYYVLTVLTARVKEDAQ